MLHYLQISITNFHHLDEEEKKKKIIQVTFSWVLVKLPPEYRFASEISLLYGNTKMNYFSFDSLSPTTVAILSDPLLDSRDILERKFWL